MVRRILTVAVAVLVLLGASGWIFFELFDLFFMGGDVYEQPTPAPTEMSVPEPTPMPTATPVSSASGGVSLGCLPFANDIGERHTDGEVRCWADYANDDQEAVQVRWTANGQPVTSSITNGASHTLYYTPPATGRYWLEVEVHYPDGTDLRAGTTIVMETNAAGPLDAGGGGAAATDGGPTATPCRGLLCVEVEEPVEIPGQ